MWSSRYENRCKSFRIYYGKSEVFLDHHANMRLLEISYSRWYNCLLNMSQVNFMSLQNIVIKPVPGFGMESKVTKQTLSPNGWSGMKTWKV